MKDAENLLRIFKTRTDYKRETLAGITTFLTMAYIIVVNPAILEAAGISKGPSMTATIITAAFGSLLLLICPLPSLHASARTKDNFKLRSLQIYLAN